jgi:hypothetical protein
LPFARLSFQLLGPGFIALLGCARFLVHMMMVAPRISRESGSHKDGHQEEADGKFSHSVP